ncbi:MAG TPA: hypothetical protein VH475_14535 [Tepidisphaeraceae bacterium]
MPTPMDDAQMAYYTAQQFGIAWSPEQLVRLEHEWRQLQRNFAYHPHVRITPLRGNPPSEYQVDFTARTLFVREDGQLDYVATPAVHVWLPPGYPHEPPVVRPAQAIFHPNVTMDGIGVNPAWEPTRTIAQLVQQVGAVLAYHTYDPWNVWNPAAMDWVTANGAYLPTDPAANFSPNAGGEPLGRICERGQATLEQLRQQLSMTCAALMSPEGAPTLDEVKRFATQVRLSTNLFLDDDVPESLRGPATELDQWAEALPSSTFVFEGLRQRHATAASVLQAAGRLAEVRRALLKEIAEFENLVTDPAPDDPVEALRRLPDPNRLHVARSAFRSVAAEAEKRLGTARGRLATLAPPDPRINFSHSALLERTIEGEVGRAAWVVQDAREKAEAAVNTIAPTVDRANQELALFDRVIAWHEFAELSRRSRELVERILAWGSAGVQAYFVENEGGVFGPFEFEQRLELGDSVLAIRNVGRTAIDVYDLLTGSKVAKSQTGAATVNLPGGEPGVTYPTTFRMTARCDDLWVQLEYLTRQLGELLSRLAKPVIAPRGESWAKAYDRILSKPDAMGDFVDQTRRGIVQRDALAAELKLVAHYKERMTTQFLVERHAESLPTFKQELATARERMADANQRIGAIIARSPRDAGSGQPLIPPKLAKEFESQVGRRDEAHRQIERMERRLARAIKQIRPRLETPALYGSDAIPELSVLAPLPDELLARAQWLGDPVMDQQIIALEQGLGERLRPDDSARPVSAVDRGRPATPGISGIARPPHPTGDAAAGPSSDDSSSPSPVEDSNFRSPPIARRRDPSPVKSADDRL